MKYSDRFVVVIYSLRRLVVSELIDARVPRMGRNLYISWVCQSVGVFIRLIESRKVRAFLLHIHPSERGYQTRIPDGSRSTSQKWDSKILRQTRLFFQGGTCNFRCSHLHRLLVACTVDKQKMEKPLFRW